MAVQDQQLLLEPQLRPLCHWGSSWKSSPELLLEFPVAAAPHHLHDQSYHLLLHHSRFKLAASYNPRCLV